MTTTEPRLLRRILDALAAFRSATRVASATESGRAPKPADLARLGIDAAAFAAIGRG